MVWAPSLEILFLYKIFYILNFCWNILSCKIKNYVRLSESDVILFKQNKHPAIALDPSSEIWVLDKIFYISIYCWKIVLKIKNSERLSSS